MMKNALSVIVLVLFLCSCKTTITVNGEDGKIIREDWTVWLEGEGVDNSGNEVDGSNLVWVSGIDGELGSGNLLKIPGSDLTEGDHEITLKFKSYNSSAENDSVNLTIRYLKPVLAKKEKDYGADGTTDQLIIYSHDATTGVLTSRSESQLIPNSQATALYHYYYRYDGKSEWIKGDTTVPVTGEYDYLEGFSWYYGAGEPRIDSKTYQYEWNTPGMFQHTHHYKYDVDGILDSIGKDTSGDNIPDEITYHTIDSLGDVIVEEEDLDVDGVIDARTNYFNTYKDGKLIEKVVIISERNGDDVFETESKFKKFYTYDDDGNKTMVEVDQDIDLTLDAITHYTYELR